MNAKKLIEEIQVEKKIAISEGRLREEKALEPITDNDVPRKLPEGWEWCRLGDYAMKVTDYVASGSFASLKENVLITNDENYAVMVKTADFSNGFTKNLTYTDKQGYNFLENSNLFGGELILSNIGSIGKVFIVPDLKRPMTLASNTIMVRMTHNEYNKYMYYMFKSSFGQGLLMSISSGTSMLKFNKTQLKSTIIPIAPLEEQFRICDILDKVQGIIDKREKELEELDNLIKARFVEMFGDPVSNSLNQPILAMTDVCEIIDGDRGVNYPKQEDFYNDEYCLFLNAKNVTKKGFDFSECMFITKEKDEQLRKGKLKRGDVVLTTRGTLGNIAFYTKDIPFDNVRINSGMVILRLNRDIIDETFFIEQFRMQVDSIKTFVASGSAQPQLPISTMNKIKVLMPDLELQKQYSQIIEQIDKSKFMYI